MSGQTVQRSHQSKRQTSLPSHIRLFMAAMVFLAVGSGVALRIDTGYLGRPGLLVRYTFVHLNKYEDTKVFYYRFLHFGTSGFFDASFGQMFNYAPSAAVLMRTLFWSPLGVKQTLFLTAGLWLGLISVLFLQSLLRRGVNFFSGLALTLTALGLCFPIYLMLYLANLELFVWIILSTGIWAFYNERRSLAAGLFAVSGSLKYFPLALFGLFRWFQDWRKLLVGGVVLLAVTIPALFVVGSSPMNTLQGLQTETARFSDQYLFHWSPESTPIDHSLFGLVKLLLFKSGHSSLIPTALAIYYPTVVLALIALYHLRIRKLSSLNQLLALTVGAVWLMPLSHDYTLVHLLAPFAAFCLASVRPKSNVHARALNILFVCFALTFAPLTFCKKWNGSHMHFEGPSRLR